MKEGKRSNEQKVVNHWLKDNICEEDGEAVFFTLKFHRKRSTPDPWVGAKNTSFLYGPTSINEDNAEKLLSRFLNELDRAYIATRAVRRGIRLKRVVFKHQGYSGENVHFHGVLFCEGDAEEFRSKCEEIWANISSNNWIDVNKSQFEIADSVSDTCHYSAHEVYKLGAEASWMIKYSHVRDAHRRTEMADQLKTFNLRKKRLMTQAV